MGYGNPSVSHSIVPITLHQKGCLLERPTGHHASRPFPFAQAPWCVLTQWPKGDVPLWVEEVEEEEECSWGSHSECESL